MLNLISRFFSRENRDRSAVRANFKEYFFSLPEHKWILNSEAKKHFDKMISVLPSTLLENLMTKWPVTFVPSEMVNMRNPGLVLTNTVVIFPEFQKLLHSKKKSAVAYLAHELAFLILEIEGSASDTVMAEVEADKFVSDLGLTFELEEFLLMLDETIEKRLRLTYLTMNHFSSNSN